MAAQQPMRNLARPAAISSRRGTRHARLPATLNASTPRSIPAIDELRARMAAYELAARMQLSAPEVSDLAARTGRTSTQLYGTGDTNPLKAAYARNCLLARRLLEQGVRYVNLYCASRAQASMAC